MIYLLNLMDMPIHTPCSPARLRELETLCNPSVFRQKRGAEALLWYAFSNACPDQDFPFDYARTETGKPYFPQYPKFQFSLSHTHSHALCAAYDAVCGVDLEAVGRVSKAVIGRFFHPLERSFLAGCMPAQQMVAAAQIWCLREAYAKALGSGLPGLGSDFWVLPDGRSNVQRWRFRAYLPDPGLAAAVCVWDREPDIHVCHVRL